MKGKEIIPVKKEVNFLFKTIAFIVTGVAAALLILYLLLSKPTGSLYGDAFRSMAQVFSRLNYYILGAIIVQMIISTVAVYLLALHFSHKIAGPVFRLKRELNEYIKGKKLEKITFRATDFIPGVSKLFTEFFSHLNEREKNTEEADTLFKQLKVAKGAQRTALIKKLKIVLAELEK